MKNKYFKYLSIILLFAMLGSMSLRSVSADVGNSFGGDSDSGSDSSYDDSSYDSDSSYDNDSSYHSSGGGNMSDSESVVVVLGLIILIVIAIFSRLKNNTNQTGGSGRALNEERVQPKSSRNILNEEIVVSNIKKLDPNFSVEQFKSYVSEVYIIVQEAWESRNYKVVRPRVSDLLFDIHSRQLQAYIDKQKTNHIDGQNIRNVQLAYFEVDGNYEVLSVKLDASIIDYVTNDNTGMIIEGSKEYQHRSYYLEFIRSNGVKSDINKEVTTKNCPNCGAPLKVTNSGECEYCKSIITSGDYNWVLNKYAKW